jgi:hypothetical protein
MCPRKDITSFQVAGHPKKALEADVDTSGTPLILNKCFTQTKLHLSLCGTECFWLDHNRIVCCFRPSRILGSILASLTQLQKSARQKRVITWIVSGAPRPTNRSATLFFIKGQMIRISGLWVERASSSSFDQPDSTRRKFTIGVHPEKRNVEVQRKVDPYDPATRDAWLLTCPQHPPGERTHAAGLVAVQ